MPNETLIPNRIVKRARDPKIKSPTTPKEKREQEKKQKEMVDVVKEGKRLEALEAKRLARQAGEANAESENFGVLTGRAAEIPIIGENGKKSRFAADDADEGAPKRQKTRRKIKG